MPTECPVCGSEKLAYVIYGLPNFDAELMELHRKGDVLFHGCVIMGKKIPFVCKKCGLGWGSFEDLIFDI